MYFESIQAEIRKIFSRFVNFGLSKRYGSGSIENAVLKLTREEKRCYCLYLHGFTIMLHLLVAVANSVNPKEFTGDKYNVLMGNREWMEQNGISITPVIDQLMIMQEELGQTAILVAVNGMNLITHTV